jgi:hypothetical protein
MGSAAEQERDDKVRWHTFRLADIDACYRLKVRVRLSLGTRTPVTYRVPVPYLATVGGRQVLVEG